MKNPALGSVIVGVLAVLYAEQPADTTVSIKDTTPVKTVQQPANTINQSSDLEAEARHLRMEAEKLLKQADELSKAADSLSSQIANTKQPSEPEKSAIKNKVHAIKDTIQILTREGAAAFLESFKSKKRGSRERGYGGGVGLLFNCYALNLKRAKEAVAKDPELAGLPFPIHGTYETFFLFGGMGYGGLGKGIRIGGGGMTGSRSYSAQRDTFVYTVDIGVSMGGFLLEKCFVKNNMNLQIGGLLGGGHFTIDTYKRKSGDLFQQNENPDTEKQKEAQLILMEMHTGFTYSLLNWLHIGLNISTPFIISPEGFTVKSGMHITDGFASFNPGILIRLIIGNIG